MTELDIHFLEPHEQADWPQELLQSAGFTALKAWPGFVQRVYGYPFYRLEAKAGGKVVGLIVLSEVRHPIFGNYLTTAPFASYGGFAFDSSDVRDALLMGTRSLVQDLDVDYALVRFNDDAIPVPNGWIQHSIYSTYLLDLTKNAKMFLPQFSSNHRNHVRKSLRKGFEVRFGRLDLLDDAYAALARSMHELGSPYHSKKYLREMAEALGNSLEFAVVYNSYGILAGAGVFIFHAGSANNLHANILHQFRKDYAGEFLYWSVLSRYCNKGFHIFDMGRSLIGSGNEVFKLKWKPRVRPLAYWYYLRDGTAFPALNQKNPKFRLAIWTWKRLPAFVVRFLGPGLIRGLA